jgi:hypothetical protein
MKGLNELQRAGAKEGILWFRVRCVVSGKRANIL